MKPNYKWDEILNNFKNKLRRQGTDFYFNKTIFTHEKDTKLSFKNKLPSSK